jgi:hypothetical protein
MRNTRGLGRIRQGICAYCAQTLGKCPVTRVRGDAVHLDCKWCHSAGLIREALRRGTATLRMVIR